MKFTLAWLKEHLETGEPLDRLVDKLTMIGLEVERVDDRAKTLAPFTIARVISAEQHPNADRLRVCIVDTGTGDPVQVVCGAPNARAGMTGVFSPPGSFIPGKDLTLGVGKIRGVESRGMLVSEFELQISDDHEGIIDLPADAPVGANYAAWAGLDDPMIEINLTPNRPDCTGVSGVARDLAAARMGKLKTVPVAPVAGAFPCPVSVSLDFGSTPSLCPGFALRLVRGVKNGPSPDWLQRRLIAIGLRPINALVDITNYITYDRARPLHVFDAAKVTGDLVVRRGRIGETLVALDGKTYTLDDSMCVIADAHGVESLAGIMGGEASGCSAETTDVLIESALWDPMNIAQTGRKLGINSDARYRFERGVDPSFAIPGLELATRMVLDLGGGTPSSITAVGDFNPPQRVIEFPLREVERLGGLRVDPAEVGRILRDIGCSVAGNGPSLRVTVPSWRPDIEGKADLVEEVVRLVGVEQIQLAPFDRGDGPRKPVLTSIQRRTRRAKRALAARGLVEAVTWSFVSKPQAELFGGGKPDLALANPIASDLSDMRPSLIPGLVMAAQRNADRGFPDVALFEVGQIFQGDQPEQQLTAAAAVRRHRAKPTGGRHWSTGGHEVDVFDAKADALSLLAAAGAPVQSMQIVAGGPTWLHPGRSGTIQIGPQNVLGWFGQLHPKTLQVLGADGPLVAFEVFLERIPEPKARATRAKPQLELSPFQPVERDFAFVVPRTARASDIVRAAQGVDRKLITNINVFDVYEGPGIDPDKKSVAIAVTLQPREKTMTDEEIDAISAKIIAEVGKRAGAVLRG
ncbi:MAG: phenylalanine--tRNA ligase subunit beta [Xanthobacteraceae bacterium]|nr:phenylalanine--tRNA ligase subunit beta [Xanthobacteraceae bacterium]MBV9632470.1 phenylalanine--tRNA ligase subunit beta [Xanthobacteraceae bacterium]